MTRLPWHRVFLAAQLAVFSIWGGYLLVSRASSSEEFYLETKPVDPRSLLSGTYVSLAYDISDTSAGACPETTASAAELYVKLEHRGRTAVTRNGRVPVYEAVDCAIRPGKDYGWAGATSKPGFLGRRRLEYGIEHFYLNENDPRRTAKSGAVIAKVKIDRFHKLTLLDLDEKF